MGIVVLSSSLDRDSKWHAGNGRSEGPARICRPGSRVEFETAVLDGGLALALAALSSGRGAFSAGRLFGRLGWKLISAPQPQTLTD